MHPREKRRDAVSPVLATVILIAITLIAAVAIAGFVFGLFGSFTSTAQVSVATVACTQGGTAGAYTVTCLMNAQNTGSGNAVTVANSASLNYGGKVYAGTNPATTIVSGSTTPLTLNFGILTGTPITTQGTSGSQLVGSFSLSNGANVQFTGVFS
jgi:archaeal type IV pilus assembly protein PilA